MKVANISIDVIRKDIKNLYLRVHSPDGRVCISSPRKLDNETIRQFALTKLDWIRTKQAQYQDKQEVYLPQYVSGEFHYYQGDRLKLKVNYHAAAPKVVLRDTQIDLHVRHGSIKEQREQVLYSWYRQQLKAKLPQLIAKWQKVIGVKTNDWGVKKMKTRWGTCNTRAKRIWLNLELIKQPPHCLEYVVVHELVHLLERYHGDRFQAYMDKFMPDWRAYQAEINSFNG